LSREEAISTSRFTRYVGYCIDFYVLLPDKLLVLFVITTNALFVGNMVSMRWLQKVMFILLTRPRIIVFATLWACGFAIPLVIVNTVSLVWTFVEEGGPLWVLAAFLGFHIMTLHMALWLLDTNVANSKSGFYLPAIQWLFTGPWKAATKVYFILMYGLPRNKIYSTNRSSGSQIRLLVLAPGRPCEQIVGTLKFAELEANTPAYTALSYTWGSKRFLRCISLNGSPFIVTKISFTLSNIYDLRLLSDWCGLIPVASTRAISTSAASRSGTCALYILKQRMLLFGWGREHPPPIWPCVS
jgi:hypothetical protein